MHPASTGYAGGKLNAYLAVQRHTVASRFTIHFVLQENYESQWDGKLHWPELDPN